MSKRAVVFLLPGALIACGHGDGASNNAEPPDAQVTGLCGDGLQDDGEQCDDGIANSDFAPNACRTNCRLPRCGDWIIDTGEECDEGPATGVSPSTCKADCTHNVCGDGYLGGGEVCDDGNAVSGDGCRGDCGQDETLCGNSASDPGEECDDGELNSDDLPNACRTDCRAPRCGDGVLDAGERCDDGDNLDDLSCSSDCLSFCGDGVLDPQLGEECDTADLNGQSPSRCLADCTLTRCGDGHLGGDEECDDGALVDGDGCAADCQMEPRWSCSGSPSLCECSGYAHGPACAGCVVFVDISAMGPADGRSWASAYRTVQQGVDAAAGAEAGCEVWVAGGRYHVFQNSPLDTLRLRSGVSLYGGFAGNETAREMRDATAYPAILDGSAEGDDSRRVFHVVTAVGTDDATVDGFTFNGGAATGSSLSNDDSGGGLYAYATGRLLFKACRFTDNSASAAGGGACLFMTPSLSFLDCTFHGNQADQGGGVACFRASPTVSGCRFVANDSFSEGGGMYNSLATPSVQQTVFSDNRAGEAG
ncbi:MAG: DUF4215 domain-containing protein, partial [Polyangia bacterium]|nr:DUF4215 domain-containing protein [Polyangia bacterium]